jgi:polyferredoxin
MAKKSGVQISRIAVLAFFLILITFAATMHQIIGGGPDGVPSIDSLCPFGGLEIVYKYLSSAGEFIKRTNVSNFILLGGTMVLAVVAGRFFCGWICMIGFLQELFGKIGLKLFKKRFVVPVRLDKPLRFLKYLILFAVIFLTWRTGELIIRPYDPFAAYAHIPAGLSVFQDLFWGMMVLIVSLVASMFVDRFFCKYLCPMGAFLGIINKMSIFRIKRQDSTCIHCSKCSKICPVNIDVEKTDTVRSSECINCMQCITVCPTVEKKTMTANMAGRFLRLAVIIIIGLGIYLGIVGISMVTGIWKTQESSLKETVTEGDVLNPDNIRGFMTMEDIAKTFNLNINDLYGKLGITKKNVPVTTQMKKVGELAAKDGKVVGEAEVRNAVKELLNDRRPDKKNDNETSQFKANENMETPVNERKTDTKSSDIQVKKTDAVTEDKKKTGTDNALPDADEIKGTMSLNEIAVTYRIDIAVLYNKLKISKENIPENTTGKELKSILSKEGRIFEIQEIRDAVRELQK